MRKQSGFTVVELLVTSIFVILSIALIMHQMSQIDKTSRDRERKTAINAMYYSLEEVYYPANNSYPRNLSSSIIPAIDPALFTDPNNLKLGTQGSNYRYEGLDCDGKNCKSYKLEADLETEAQYVKKSRH